MENDVNIYDRENSVSCIKVVNYIATIAYIFATRVDKSIANTVTGDFSNQILACFETTALPCWPLRLAHSWHNLAHELAHQVVM